MRNRSCDGQAAWWLDGRAGARPGRGIPLFLGSKKDQHAVEDCTVTGKGSKIRRCGDALPDGEAAGSGRSAPVAHAVGRSGNKNAGANPWPQGC